MYNIYL